MSSMKITLKKWMKKFHRFYYIYREFVKLRVDRDMLWDDAVAKFKEENPEKGSIDDYKNALYCNRVSYVEYMHCYEFWKLDKMQRDKFVSEKEMSCIYRKSVQVNFDRLCRNKVLLLKKFRKYVHRPWTYSDMLSIDTFIDFVSSKDCVGKPIGGTIGRGVFMIRKEEDHDWQKLFEYCREHKILVEERVRACRELEDFHPQSLNTIRVFTISKDGRCELVASELRVGVGDNIVDNASAGGIVAAIDLETGIIIGDGADKAGNRYKAHPDTGKVFKGFVIPHWQKVVDMCKEMSIIVPEMVFAGWDICVLPNGDIEMMEVNSYPNITGLQTAYQKGLKPRLSALGKEVLGYDPVKLISIWSKSYVKYESVYGRY